jgi:hypothetical protein
MFENMLDHPNIKFLHNCDYREVKKFDLISALNLRFSASCSAVNPGREKLTAEPQRPQRLRRGDLKLSRHRRSTDDEGRFRRHNAEAEDQSGGRTLLDLLHV